MVKTHDSFDKSLAIALIPIEYMDGSFVMYYDLVIACGLNVMDTCTWLGSIIYESSCKRKINITT